MARKSSKNTFFLLAFALLIAILLVTVMALNPLPHFIWNASKSVPIGLYWIEFRQPSRGEIAVVKLEDWPQLYAAERGYLPENVWLLKPVMAVFPSTVCRFGNYVLINGKLVAKAKNIDRQHRILPRWKGCLALKFGEVFLVARPKDSFDSRYFGVIKMAQVAGVAHRLRFPFE